MCSAVIDPAPAKWLHAFLGALSEGPVDADDIWSHCTGWPDEKDSQVGFLLDGFVPSLLQFATYDHPADEICRALRLHDQLNRLAIETRTMSDGELHAAYRRTFPA
jgi:hypothetical protein